MIEKARIDAETKQLQQQMKLLEVKKKEISQARKTIRAAKVEAETVGAFFATFKKETYDKVMESPDFRQFADNYLQSPKVG
jgi:prefoldin subunit 5